MVALSLVDSHCSSLLENALNNLKILRSFHRGGFKMLTDAPHQYTSIPQQQQQQQQQQIKTVVVPAKPTVVYGIPPSSDENKNRGGKVHFLPSLELAGSVHTPNATKQPVKPILKKRSTVDSQRNSNLDDDDRQHRTPLAHHSSGNSPLLPQKRSRKAAFAM